MLEGAEQEFQQGKINKNFNKWGSAHVLYRSAVKRNFKLFRIGPHFVLRGALAIFSSLDTWSCTNFKVQSVHGCSPKG